MVTVNCNDAIIQSTNNDDIDPVTSHTYLHFTTNLITSEKLKHLMIGCDKK